MFFVISRQLFTVEKASETVPPTIGTTVPIKSLAVFDNVLSAEEVMSVPSPRIPEKTVVANVSSQMEKFLMVFEISPILTSETEDTIDSAIYMQISGAIISDETLEIIVTALSISVLYPAAEVIFPDAIIAEE